MSIIRNVADLFHGNVEGRKAALEIIEHAIATVNAYDAVRKIIRLDEDMLRVGHLNYDLSEINNIYVLGAGKASFEIAEALEDILEERIRDGVIIEKAGRGRTLKKIKVIGC